MAKRFFFLSLFLITPVTRVNNRVTGSLLQTAIVFVARPVADGRRSIADIRLPTVFDISACSHQPRRFVPRHGHFFSV